MNHDLYMGEVDEDGRPHGRGARISKYGGLFEGHFKDGQRHGRGRLIYPSGQYFEGEFWKDHQNGNGKIVYPKLESMGLEAGSYKLGTWEDGEIIECIWYDKDGN